MEKKRLDQSTVPGMQEEKGDATYHILVSTFFSGCTTILGKKGFQSEGLFLLPPGLQGPVQPARAPVLPDPRATKHQCFSSARAGNTSLPREERMHKLPCCNCSLEILRSMIKVTSQPFCMAGETDEARRCGKIWTAMLCTELF